MEPAWTDNTVSWLANRAARCPTETATAELASPRALRSTGNFGRVVDRPRVSISGGRDDVHVPVHGLRRGHPDQAAEAEALRAVRQGRGPRLQPLELPRPPRRAARVAQHRRRGGKLLIWTRVLVAPGGDCRRAFFASRAGRGASLP